MLVSWRIFIYVLLILVSQKILWEWYIFPTFTDENQTKNGGKYSMHGSDGL